VKGLPADAADTTEIVPAADPEQLPTWVSALSQDFVALIELGPSNSVVYTALAKCKQIIDQTLNDAHAVSVVAEQIRRATRPEEPAA
jgi:hypothetical protein